MIATEEAPPPHFAPRALLVAAGRISLVLLAVTSMLLAWSVMGRLGIGLVPYYGMLAAMGAGIAIVPAARRFWPLAVYLIGLNVYSFIWSRVDDLGHGPHFDYVIVLDRIAGLGQVPTVWLQERLYEAGATGPHDIGLTAVYLSFFAISHVAFVSLWLYRREALPRFLLAFLLAMFGGLVAFALAPTAPPWMAAERGLIEPVERIAHTLLVSVDASTYSTTYAAADVNEVASMPSLHVGVTVIVAVALIRAVPGVASRVIGWTYVALMSLALVYLGEHYVIDVVAGIATGLLAWRAADALAARWASRRAGRAVDQAPVESLEERRAA